MNLLKISLTRVMVAFAAIAFVMACNKPEGEAVDTLPNLKLTIDVEDVTTTTAKIRVTHELDAHNTWYGFVTSDATTPVNELVSSTMANFDKAELHKSKQYVTLLDNLTPDTDYRYIAYGLTADGVRYGEIAIAEFKTLANATPDDNNGMRENDAWTVMYIGEGELNGAEYEHIVKVLSTDDNSYAITIVYADSYDVSQMRDLAEAMLVDMHKYLNDYNAMNGTDYSFGDMLYMGNNADAFDLNPGRYRAIAVGYTFDGEVSGHYAVSDEFEVSESIASLQYLSWIGKWNIEGQNGVTTAIDLSKQYSNKSFVMTGWEGFYDLPVVVEYNAELDSIFFYSQLVAEDYYLGEEYGKADIYFFAGDKDGYYYDNEGGDYYIAIGGILDDGVRAIVRYGVNVPDYPKFTQMFYMADINGKMYTFTAADAIPSFIAGMYPMSQTTSCKMATYGHRRLQPAMKLMPL